MLTVVTLSELNQIFLQHKLEYKELFHTTVARGNAVFSSKLIHASGNVNHMLPQLSFFIGSYLLTSGLH